MANSITISVVDNWIEVRGPYEAKDILKAIPTARWSKPKEAWRYPAAPDTAQRLMYCISAANYSLNYSQKTNEIISELLDESAMRNIIERCGAPNVEARGLKTKFWAHQQQAYNMAMALKYNMLAMDMGTGKTLVALAVMENTDAQFTLIFCPRYVVPVWGAEAVKHLDNPPAQILELGSEFGPIAKRIERLKLGRQWCQQNDKRLLAILNYDAVAASRGKGGKIAARQLQDYLLSEQWDFVILDEIQRVKAPGGATSKFIAQLRDHATRRTGMSGTLYHSTPLDVYGPYRFISPDLFGTSYARMKAEFAEEDRWGGVARIINEAELHRRTYRIAFRVRADDVLDLPEATEVVRKCELEPKARITYGELEAHMITEIKGGVITAANGAVKLLRLIQLTGGWINDENGEPHKVSSAKPGLFNELLNDLGPREPLVVFCYFVKDLDTVRLACEKDKRTVSELSGRTGTDQYLEWKDGRTDVLVAQIKAGSVGIDLTRARIAVIYSLGLISQGDWDQVQRRLIRPGQTRPVQFIHLHAKATRDASVLNALRKNTAVVKYILDEMRSGNV